MIERVVVVILILALLGSITIGVINEPENLIQNGTFDTDLTHWNTDKSQNMTIGITNGLCNMTSSKVGSYTGPGPDYYVQVNYTGFSTGTFYNLTLHSGRNISTPTGPMWDDYMEVASGCANGSYLSDVLYCNDAHVGGQISNPKVNYTPYYTNWIYIFVFTTYSTYTINYTVSTRTGVSSTVDSLWSPWTSTSYSGIAFPMGNLVAGYWIINSPISLYYQYKVEFLDPVNSLYGTWAAVQTVVETYEYGQITQSVTKTASGTSNISYNYMIEEQNNTKELYLYTRINNSTVNVRNVTGDVGWITVDVDLPNEYNPSGTYELEIYLFDGFNSSNGSATVLIDNIGFYVTYTVSVYAILFSLLPLLVVILVVRVIIDDMKKSEKSKGGKST